jgi:transcriptional regulator with XRE-family HTH domain
MSSVTQYRFPASLPWSEKLVSKLSERDYRHAYMMEGVKTWIARQVRALREQRGWSQDDLGRETEKPQSAISRVEDPDYGKLTLQTLFDLARAYDVPLLVQFVEWSDWLCRMNDRSTASLQRESFSASALADIGAGQVGVNETAVWTEFVGSRETQGWRSVYAANSGLTKLLFIGVGQINRSATVIYGDYDRDVSAFEYHDEEVDFDTPIRFTPHAPLNVAEVENG